MKNRAQTQIRASSSGFAVHQDGKPDAKFMWGDIRQAEAYKLDAFTIDIVCVTLQLSDGIELTLNEDMEGFKDFTTEMNSALGVDPEWQRTVVLPPFEESRIQLFPLAP